MRPLLDDPGHDSTDLLDALDAEYAAEIDRLVRRRRLIARLRADGAPPDVPPELVPFLKAFADAYPSPAMAGFDRDQTLLLAHFGGEPALADLTRLYERLSAPDLLPAVVAWNVRFTELAADAPREEIESLIDEFVEAFTPVLDEITTASIDLSDRTALLDAYSDDVLNPAQRQAFALITERFAALLPDR